MAHIHISSYRSALGETRDKDAHAFTTCDPIPLGNDNTLTLGRSDVKLDDNRISREQVAFKYDKNHDILTVCRIGRNQNFIIRSNWNEYIDIPNDKDVELKNGDLVSLMADQYWLQVTIQEEPRKNKRKIEQEETQDRHRKLAKIERSNDPERSLAFYPLAVGTNQYDETRAFSVLEKAVQSFFAQHQDQTISLYLILPNDISQEFKDLVSEHHFDERLRVIEGDILSHNKYRFITSECNWRFVGKGGGLNAIINTKDPSVLINAKSQFGKADVGNVYPVETDAQSILRKEHGIGYVLNVLLPNMNPNRQDCMDGNYDA
jgi:O-acetyl-ADP-ribose deacetylase (regulator of RNase III)